MRSAVVDAPDLGSLILALRGCLPETLELTALVGKKKCRAACAGAVEALTALHDRAAADAKVRLVVAYGRAALLLADERREFQRLWQAAPQREDEGPEVGRIHNSRAHALRRRVRLRAPSQRLAGHVVQPPAVLCQRAAVVEGAPRDAAPEARAAPEPGLALP